MAIEFHCPNCNRLMRTPDQTAGKKGKCPGCGSITDIPAPRATGATATPKPGEKRQPAQSAESARTASDKVEFPCSACGRTVRTAAALAGKKGKCPGCGAVFTIPAFGDTPSQSQAKSTDKSTATAATRRSPASQKSGEQSPKPKRDSETSQKKKPADAQTIMFPCSECGKPMRTPASAAGGKGRCPNCSAVVRIPTKKPRASTPSASSKQATTKPQAKPQPTPKPKPQPKPRPKPQAKPQPELGLAPLNDDGLSLLDDTPGLAPSDDDISLTPLGDDAALTPLGGDDGLSLLDGDAALSPMDGGGGLMPLGADPGLTPLGGDVGLSPIDGGGGLTPLGGDAGLTPLGGGALADSPFGDFMGGGAPAANPYQSPAMTPAKPRQLRRRGDGFGYVEVLSCTWSAFCDNWAIGLLLSLTMMGVFILLSVALGLLQLGAAFALKPLAPTLGPGWLLAILIAGMIFMYVVLLVLMLFFQGGLIRFSVAVVKGENPSIGEVFQAGDAVLGLFLVWLLQMLIGFGLGLVLTLPFILLFVLAGQSPTILILARILITVVNIVVSILLMLTPYFVVDQQSGVIDAFSESVSTMKDKILSTFALLLTIGLGLVVFTLCTLGIGLLLVFPFGLFFMAALYCKAASQRTAY